MTLTVNRTEEKEPNWADLLDGLRYAGFRRSVAPGRINPELFETSDSGDTGSGDAIRKPAESESS